MSKAVKLIIVGSVVLIGGFTIAKSIASAQKKSEISSAYNTLTLPAGFKLVGQEYVSGGIDTEQSWSYSYTVDVPANQLVSSLVTSLAAQGCAATVSGGDDFECSNKKLHLTAEGVAGSAGHTQPPFSVRITASSLRATN